jgi:hypothetical protein
MVAWCAPMDRAAHSVPASAARARVGRAAAGLAVACALAGCARLDIHGEVPGAVKHRRAAIHELEALGHPVASEGPARTKRARTTAVDA